MIKIRVDDFPQTKGEPQHTLEAFKEFDRVLRECTGGKKYLLGVIPERCSSDDLNFIRDETDCIVGMHGIWHDESKLDLYGNEFPPYLSKEQIKYELSSAVGDLERAVARQINIYMPPRNLIDARTLSCLIDCGFSYFTAGPETDRMIVRNTIGSQLYSHAPHEYGRTDEMLANGSHVVLAERSSQRPVIITLHWTWETNIGLEHMVKFFSKIPKEHFCDFDEKQ